MNRMREAFSCFTLDGFIFDHLHKNNTPYKGSYARVVFWVLLAFILIRR